MEVFALQELPEDSLTDGGWMQVDARRLPAGRNNGRMAGVGNQAVYMHRLPASSKCY